MKTNIFISVFVIAILLVFTGQIAHAACSSPVGAAGELEYDTTDDRFEYCNDTNWIAIGESTTSGLVSHWKLDETTGSTITDSAGSHDGTWADGSGNSVAEETIDAVIDTGIDFSGVDNQDRIDVTSHADLNDVDEVTISTWIKLDSIASNPNSDQIVAKGDWNNANSYSFAFYWGFLRCNIGMIWSAGATYADTNFTTGQWYHVVCRANGSGTKLYVDGEEVATDSTVPGAVTNTDILRIGHWAGASNNQEFDGVIDDVKFYDRALSDSEIEELYDAGREDALVGHWKLDETSGTTAVDSSPSGNDGSYTNSPTQVTTGILGNALEFSGNTGANATNDRVDIGDQSELNFGSNSFSYGVWVNPSGSAGSFDMPWHKGGSSATPAGYDIELGSGAWRAHVSDGDEPGGDVNITGAPIIDEWSHVFVVINRDLDEEYTYLNGAHINTLSLSGTFGSTSSTAAATIGANSTGGFPFQGKIDDMRVYDRALNDSEVEDIYNEGLSDGLVGYWKLDESSGTTAVDSAGSNNGSWQGTPTAESDGKINGAISFDAIGDFVDAGSPASLEITGDVSIAAWINATSFVGNDIGVVSYTQSGETSATNELYRMVIETDGDVSIGHEHSSGSNQYTTLSTALETDTWYHLAATRDVTANEWKLYVNGTQSGSTYNYTTDPTGGTSGRLRIGQHDTENYDDQFRGKIDDVRVYDRTLSAAEIATLFSIGAPETSSCTKQSEMYYDSANNVYKYCDGDDEILMGPSPGAGGSGCSTPTASAGAIQYNSTTDKLQYCDGAAWVNAGE